MEKLTFEEKNEIAQALQARIQAMKEFIATGKQLGFDTSNYETSLSLCQTLIKKDKIWTKL